MSGESPGGEETAQTQMSTSGRRDMRTHCVSSVDNNTASSACRLDFSCRRQQDDEDEDEDAADVSRLPDSVVTKHLNSDIRETVRKENRLNHQEALQQMDTHLSHLSQVCEMEVRTLCEQLKSSLEEVDLRLDTLKDRMGHLEHASLEEVCGLWEEVKEEGRKKQTRISEFNLQLTDSEGRRAEELRAILRRHCQLLKDAGFLSPPEVHRLIHSEAMTLNQALLANRRSVARLVLHLREGNMQQEFLLRLQWEDHLNSWRSIRIDEVVDQFRRFCSSEEHQLLSDQQMKQTLLDLTKQRCDVIKNISTLVPPTSSSAVVSDWFDHLTAVNQQIDLLHVDSLHQLRSSYEHRQQDLLAEVKRCEDELSALQLSDQQVNDIVSSKLLPLIGRIQSQDEERLAALDVKQGAVARHALRVSRCVFAVMRAVALLWETHCYRLKRREEEQQQRLDDVKQSHQKCLQMKRAHIDVLLGEVRQESSEDAMKTSLDKMDLDLQDMKDSCRKSVFDQWKVLELLPDLLLMELISYSSSISSFFQLNHAFLPVPVELQPLLNRTSSPVLETSDGTETLKLQTMKMENWISGPNEADPTLESPTWLMEAKSSLLQLYDVSTNVTVLSSEGVAYKGPAFTCPAVDLPDDLQQEEDLSLFPADQLRTTLSSTRVLVLKHVEECFSNSARPGGAMVTKRKEAIRLEQEHLLQPLEPEHIQTHIYEPRLAELQLHQQRVDNHCQDLLDVLSPCRMELQQLQTSILMKNQDLSSALSNMEDDVQTVDSSSRLAAVSSALQDLLDHHVKDVQRCWTSFRQTVQTRVQEARTRTLDLLGSFRTFSEGGDVSPLEVEMFQVRLEEETKQMTSTQKSILSKLEVFEARSLQQVKKASAHLEKRLRHLKPEVELSEKIQNIISRTQLQIKEEAGSSNQQQAEISSRLEELRRMKEDTQVSPDQLCSVLLSTHEEITKRRQYLDLDLDLDLDLGSVGQVSADPKSRKQLRGPGADRPGGPVLSVSRSTLVQDPGSEDQQRRRPAGLDLVQRQQRGVESVGSLRERSSGTIITEKDSQVGPEQESEPSSHSFSSSVDSILRKTRTEIQKLKKDPCHSKQVRRHSASFIQCYKSTEQRLLGYEEQARRFLSSSRNELLEQLSIFQDLLSSCPAVLIGNHEQLQEAGLREDVGGVRRKLEEVLAASEEEKTSNFHQLRVSLLEEELQALDSREELRQQKLHSATISLYLELQTCVRSRSEECVMSLSSLSEKLLQLLDVLLTPAAVTHQDTVTMETGGGSRTWPGISFLFPPNMNSADPPASVTMTTTPIITAVCTQEHEEVIRHREAAVKRLQQLFSSEALRLDDDNRRYLREQQRWNTHWRRQIHSLKQIHTT